MSEKEICEGIGEWPHEVGPLAEIEDTYAGRTLRLCARCIREYGYPWPAQE